MKDPRFYKPTIRERIYNALFFEMNIFRTLTVIWLLFCGTVLVGGVFVAIHFIHKYW